MSNLNVEKLLIETSSVIKKYEQIKRITGENFNIFSILGVETKEVVICRLIKDMISIDGYKWSLQEGQDKYAFMEKSVNDDSVSHVLLICDKAYKERADTRRGGVGDETTVITTEIYGNANQTKFIPILFERDDSGNEYLPTYIKSRIYIDFSNETNYESSYEQLLRRLYDKPIFKKPQLGKPPAWLNEDSVNYNELNSLVKKIKIFLMVNLINFKN